MQTRSKQNLRLYWHIPYIYAHQYLNKNLVLHNFYVLVTQNVFEKCYTKWSFSLYLLQNETAKLIRSYCSSEGSAPKKCSAILVTW